MKAGALKTAVKVAERLEALASEQSAILDTLAEVAFYAEGNTDKALALSARAIRNASVDEREVFIRNLQRFRRNKKEPSDALIHFEPPDLVPREQQPPQGTSVLPTSLEARVKVENILSVNCWQQASGIAGELRVVVLTASKAGAHRLIFPGGTHGEWALCASKAIQTLDLPPGVVVDVHSRGLSKAFEQSLTMAKRAAETDCASFAKSHEVFLFLTAEASQPLMLSSPPVDFISRDLHSCLEKRFNSLKPTRALMQVINLHFRNPPSAASNN
jgi:hypothetical protein